ncbi:methylenetetrahydrofolate reductase [Spirochaeta africana]|uniref:Methylenetetrahydrofolate reductase n=1 Tax=Spirochaeta africana (strain ATCC 700263 / DSM 8902 / Z-7692) TaxID=889378 RepID=H9UL29_SPIAZ|nr:methylenetetrahydrofolate reductase [Spirochaeta africana]AFG38222.1 5,10-methylenetetrahydrofolate reductase [Spirochaeta africana DSM 8902]
MNHLYTSLQQRESGLLVYGLTPPKVDNPVEKNRRITERRISRISQSPLDGVVVYDIQDEDTRTDAERPFPFLETIPSYTYADHDLHGLELPKIVYLSVGKYTPEELDTILGNLQERIVVFVGSPSPEFPARTSLRQAYEMYQKYRSRLVLGGVTIAERHRKHHNEHQKLLRKSAAGVSFFVSQCIFNAELFKDLLSDYYHICEDEGLPMQPVLMTLTPCGSLKTLEFIKWLGIQVPRWMENDIKRNRDILHYSMRMAREIFQNISDFCSDKGIPVGCNIESVAVNREEVLASFELARQIRDLQQR